MPSFCLILMLFDSRASGKSDSGNVCLYFPAQKETSSGLCNIARMSISHQHSHYAN